MPHWETQKLDTLLAECRAQGREFVGEAPDLPGRVLTLRCRALVDVSRRPWSHKGLPRARLPGTPCWMTAEWRAPVAFEVEEVRAILTLDDRTRPLL